MVQNQNFPTDQHNRCVVCNERLTQGVAVIKNHTTGEFATSEVVEKLRGTPAYEDYSLYYVGTGCFKAQKLEAFAA